MEGKNRWRREKEIAVNSVDRILGTNPLVYLDLSLDIEETYDRHTDTPSVHREDSESEK